MRVNRSGVFVSAALIMVFGAAGVRAQQPDLRGITVEDAVSIALRNNRDIENAKAETRRAEYRITEATAAAFPQVNGSLSIEKVLKPQVFVISMPDSAGVMQQSRLKVGTDYSSSLGANITQPIWVGGKVGAARKAAKIYRNISTYSEESVKQNVAFGTRLAFSGAVLSRELADIAAQALTQAENHLRNVENLRAAGSATEYDLLRARVNVSNQRPALLQAENDYQVALLGLKEIMGVSPDAPIEISGTFADPDTTVFAVVDARAALRVRPDLQAARLTIDLQDKAVAIARGDMLPTLSAGMTFAYAGNFDAFGYTASDWSRYWVADLSLTFPIFSGFKNTASYRQAKIDYAKAKTDHRKAEDSAVIEIEENSMNLRVAIRQIESQRLNVEEAGRAVEIAGNLYRNGRSTQLEVLDAQLAFEVARTNLTSALYQGNIAEVSLRKSLGLLDAGR